jgi:hypothetical protein
MCHGNTVLFSNLVTVWTPNELYFSSFQGQNFLFSPKHLDWLRVHSVSNSMGNRAL